MAGFTSSATATATTTVATPLESPTKSSNNRKANSKCSATPTPTTSCTTKKNIMMGASDHTAETLVSSLHSAKSTPTSGSNKQAKRKVKKSKSVNDATTTASTSTSTSTSTKSARTSRSSSSKQATPRMPTKSKSVDQVSSSPPPPSSSSPSSLRESSSSSSSKQRSTRGSKKERTATKIPRIEITTEKATSEKEPREQQHPTFQETSPSPTAATAADTDAAAPITINQTQKPNNNNKTVQFGERVQVTVHTVPLDTQDASHKWYSKQDLTMLLDHELRINWRSTDCHSGNKQQRSRHCCWRGLEHIPLNIHKTERVSQHVLFVLNLQDEFQERVKTQASSEAPLQVAEILRRKSRAYTKEDRKRAYKLGLQDASDVLEYSNGVDSTTTATTNTNTITSSAVGGSVSMRATRTILASSFRSLSLSSSSDHNPRTTKSSSSSRPLLSSSSSRPVSSSKEPRVCRNRFSSSIIATLSQMTAPSRGGGGGGGGEATSSSAAPAYSLPKCSFP